MSDLLIEELKKTTSNGIYPLHMPGHKRNAFFDGGVFPFDIDLTEVFGTDNLHSPESIIKDAQHKAAMLWGAKESFLLVNGSTCGVLAAIFAALRPGETILADRGSHCSVFNAIELRGLRPCFLLPEYHKNTGIRAVITPREVERRLRENPDARACIITSPTYEGAVCDIASIAKICHDRNIPLLVDSAHGAHLGFSKHFPEGAVKCGADAVVMSLHKTLPALTQTALLHIGGNLIASAAVKKYLAVFETSSPSYILMSSADMCTEILINNSEKLFKEYKQRLDRFYEKTSSLRVLSLPYAFSSPFFDFDTGKITVFCGNSGLSGYELQRILREKYKLETEMAAPTYVLAITSVCDTDEGFERFSCAVCEIDSKLSPCNKHICELSLPVPESVYTPYEASLLPCVPAKITLSKNKISAAVVSIYPPGIPILLPGERITPEVIKYIETAEKSGGKITGEQRILV